MEEIRDINNSINEFVRRGSLADEYKAISNYLIFWLLGHRIQSSLNELIFRALNKLLNWYIV